VTLDELIAALTAVKAEALAWDPVAGAGAGGWRVEMDVGPVDLPVRRVDTWVGPEDDEGNGRVVLT